MTSGFCFACVPLVMGPFTEPPSHCQGMSDVAPLSGVLGGFRCSCECNPPKSDQVGEPGK